MPLLDGLLRGRGDVDPKDWQPPTTSFPSEQAIAGAVHLAYDPMGGFLLGKAAGKRIGLDPQDDRHIALVAGTRSGKGVSHIVPNVLEYRGSVLAIDPKGELASICSRRRATALGQSVHVLDPFTITREWIRPYRKCFNPLSLLRRDNPRIIEDAALIADSFVTADGGESGAHWNESAKNFILGCLLYVATAREFEGQRDLISVYYTIGGRPPDFDELDAATRAMPRMELLKIRMFATAQELGTQPAMARVGEAIDMAATDFYERPDNERLSVLSTTRRHVSYLGLPALANVLRGHDFDLEELKTAEQGCTVFLCLPAGRMGTCAKWFKMMVEIALSKMEEVETKPRIPILFVLEEFAVMGRMASIETAAGLLATFGVKLLIVLQDLPQIKDLYHARHESLLGSAGCTIVFGNNDPTTLEYISRSLGKTSVPVDRSSPVTWQQASGGATGQSWVNEIHDLMTTNEIALYFGRDDPQQRCLIMRAGRNPIIVQRVRYWDDPDYVGKFDVWQEG